MNDPAKVLGRVHKLKTWPAYFQKILERKKTFDVRKDDRGAKLGDVLELEEWDEAANLYTGRRLAADVVYKLDGGHFGIEEGFCVLGIEVQ